MSFWFKLEVPTLVRNMRILKVFEEAAAQEIVMRVRKGRNRWKSQIKHIDV